MNFSDLGLSPETIKAVEDVGYSTPTPIQEQAIPYVLMGRDVLGIAQTGTGKTASFTLPMIDVLAQGRAKARMPRSLILAPTRELANQVAENFTLYGKYHKLTMALLIGGESFSEQEKALERGVDVLIATPGRLMDLFDRGRILLRDVKVLVIDEADRMLDMGFIPDVERIVSMLPPLRQTLFFSATMDEPIRKLADAFLSNPKEVRVAPTQSTASTVSQHLLVVDEFDKREALRHILRTEEVRNAFIFCNRKRDVSVLYRSLNKHGFDVAQLHGDMPQQERTATLATFKAGNVRFLVCSDVAARGIDIADVSHVFNFDVPTHSEDYVHRIGRTGRAGREGRAFTIATPGDAKYVGFIEKLINTAIPRLEIEGIPPLELSEEAAKLARKAGKRPADKRRDRKRDDRPVEAAVSPSIETTPESAAVMAVEGRSEARAESRQDPRNRRDRDRDRGGRSRRNHPAWEVEEMDHGDDVLAFGSHVPAFILVDPGDFSSTEEDLLSDEAADQLIDEVVVVIDDSSDADDEELPPEMVTVVDAEEQSSRGGRSRRRRGGRNRGRGEAAAVVAGDDVAPDVAANDDAEPVAVVADAEESVADDAESAPKGRQKRTSRRRSKKVTTPQAAEVAAVVVQDQAPVSAEVVSEPAPVVIEEAAPAAAPAKPRRTRAKKVVAAEEAPVGVEAAPVVVSEEAAPAPAKPKRTRVAKKVAVVEEAPVAVDAAPVVVTEEAAPAPAKPKRTRVAKKVAVVEEAPVVIEEAAPAKPKRTRVAKKAAVVEEAPAVTEEAAPAKPRRTRTKKAAPAADE
ncbi:DEAD/DEAH box helicase [Insolitispirillum peregrinum]|uniref:DEAD-box ATP-dependent RNA helicase RhpA n=1 Tax=Insolitispirillum peregrinum TaxID=80876 RepID=A0A1N7NHD7_9PROT|nr:DEAD/DEAH box helicase [Insolitispirillum peregrinum]SIS97764.1 Superfamily II DNA and RNA helicase [Insolitispirillum peregrinum]